MTCVFGLVRLGVWVPQINKDEFTAFPKELFVAAVKDGQTPESVSEALVAFGIPEDRFDFLQGPDGLRILNPDGDTGSIRERMLRKAESFAAEGRIIARAAEHLRAGRTMIGIHEVHAEEADRLRANCDELGLEDCHYLGRRKID
jgi:hypothetical protein